MRHIGGSNRTDLVERARRRSRQESIEDPAKRKLLQKHLAEAGPLLQEFVTLGFDIGTLDDLRHQRKSWKSAIPALLRWLPRISDLDVKENRSLYFRSLGRKPSNGRTHL
jgi:hypothetical protein